MESININKVLARAFINTIQLSMILDRAEPMSDELNVLFRMHTDAQVAVVFSLAGLITDRTEVLAEYDRMIAVLRDKASGTHSLTLLLESRDSLVGLLKNAINH